MKIARSIIYASLIGFISAACGGSGNGEDQSGADSTLTEQEINEVIEIDNSSREVLDATDSLENKADKILEDLNNN